MQKGFLPSLLSRPWSSLMAGSAVFPEQTNTLFTLGRTSQSPRHLLRPWLLVIYSTSFSFPTSSLCPFGLRASSNGQPPLRFRRTTTLSSQSLELATPSVSLLRRRLPHHLSTFGTLPVASATSQIPSLYRLRNPHILFSAFVLGLVFGPTPRRWPAPPCFRTRCIPLYLFWRCLPWLSFRGTLTGDPFFPFCYLSGLPSLVFLSGCLTGDPFLLYYFLGIALLAFPFGVPSRRSLSSPSAPNRIRASLVGLSADSLYLPSWVTFGFPFRPFVLSFLGTLVEPFLSLRLEIILNLVSFRGSSAAFPDNLEPRSFLSLGPCTPCTFFGRSVSYRMPRRWSQLPQFCWIFFLRGG